VQGTSKPDQQFLDAAVLCEHLLGKGSVAAFLAGNRTELFPDEMFADLFPTGRGRPSVPADVIATIMVLQSLEGLSDREAMRRLEMDISWKAACGLSLTDTAFHPTVLVLWRNKLRASDDPQRIFDAVRKVIALSGAIAGKHRRALDSTVLDDAVQRQDTIALLVTAIRKVRRLIPTLAEKVFVHEENLEGSRPLCDWDDPADVERLVSQLVEDAYELIWAAEDLELTAEQEDAIGLLALVAGQDVEPGERPGSWRIRKGTAPDRVISTVDPESRHVHKTQHAYRDGYKAHLSAEPESGLITSTDLTPGNVGDAEAAAGLLADEPEGTEVVADSAYGSGEFRQHLEDNKMSAVIKPAPLRPAVENGYTIDDFEIDQQEGRVTCPAGVTVAIGPGRRARFGANCTGCPERLRCTRAKRGRVIVLHPNHVLLAAARVFATTDEFDDVYRNERPMIERTIAWLVRGTNRKLRYRGVERNRLWLAHRAAAVNLMRLVNLGLVRDGNSWAIAG
jgi:IS5 family transposase